jgi:hypothetical protein
MADFRTNKLGSLRKMFFRVVHVTLFFELLAHALPPAARFVAIALDGCLATVETYPRAFALAFGILVGVTPEAVTLFRKRNGQTPDSTEGGESRE